MSTGSPAAAKPSKQLRAILLGFKLFGTAVGLSVAGACVRAIGLESPVRYDRLMLVGPAILGALVALLSWSAARPLQVVNALSVAGLFALLGLESAVRLMGTLPMVGDLPEYVRILREHVDRGEKVAVQWAPQNWVLSGSALGLAGAETVLPLAGLASRKTLIWREGHRPLWTYVADSHGFNNPAPAWQARTQVMLIGDSFTYGACVRNEDHFAHAIRRVRPGTVNVAQGGNGPLLELAAVREYVPELKPEIVFWVYDENNDLYSDRDTLRSDLESELLHPVLKRYLENPAFRQGLFGKAAAIATALTPIVDERIRSLIETYDSRVMEFLSLHTFRTIVRTLIGYRSYPSIRAGSRGKPGTVPPPADPEAARAERMAIFERILRQAKSEVEAAGGRLVFVNLPATTTVAQRLELPLKTRLWSSVDAIGLDAIDLEPDLVSRFPTEELFSMPPAGGHLNERGYALVAARLLEYLDLSAGKAALPLAGWTGSSRADGSRRFCCRKAGAR